MNFRTARELSVEDALCQTVVGHIHHRTSTTNDDDKDGVQLVPLFGRTMNQPLNAVSFVSQFPLPQSELGSS
jgi:hypothetical protein